MVLFNICPGTAEQQGPFKVKLCPALALEPFKKRRTSLSEWCLKSSRMEFAKISSSSHLICLKTRYTSGHFSTATDLHFTPSQPSPPLWVISTALLNDLAPRKSPNAVTPTLREGKAGTLGTPVVFCEIIQALIPLWFAARLPLKHALWQWDPAAFEFWLVVFLHQTLVTLLEKAALLAPQVAETAY